MQTMYGEGVINNRVVKQEHNDVQEQQDKQGTGKYPLYLAMTVGHISF